MENIESPCSAARSFARKIYAPRDLPLAERFPNSRIGIRWIARSSLKWRIRAFSPWNRRRLSGRVGASANQRSSNKQNNVYEQHVRRPHVRRHSSSCCRASALLRLRQTDTTITITAQIAGATPFISQLTLMASDTTVIKSVQFTITPRPRSVTRPLSGTYSSRLPRQPRLSSAGEPARFFCQSMASTMVIRTPLPSTITFWMVPQEGQHHNHDYLV